MPLIGLFVMNNQVILNNYINSNIVTINYAA